MELQKIFIKKNGVLYRLWTEDGRTFKYILVPQVLQDSMVILAHDYSGHNSSRRTYNCLKKQYYWQGIRKQVFRHCKRCAQCILQNQGQAEKGFSHFDSLDLPMEFICMDLFGPIHPASSRGNKYILTVIDMLTGFTMAVPIQNKNGDTICDVYRDHVYCTFGGSSRILKDNGSKFKNKEMKQVCETLGVKHIFSPVYTLESNGCLEGWHMFFKACIAKHIHGGGVEWDELVPLAVSAYNFFPCQSSKESPFVLIFGRDPITPVPKLFEPKPRYYGEEGSGLKMDMLRRLYTIVVDTIRKAREKKLRKVEPKLHSFKVNDMVLVKDPDSAVFELRYQPNCRITAIFGDNRIEVPDEKGHKSVRRSSHVKYVEPKEKVVQQIPSKELLQNYGRSSKMLIAAKDIPNLQFNVDKTEDTSEFQEHSKNSPEGAGEVMDCEYSRNLLSSAALRGTTPEEMTEIMFDTNLQEINSENCKHSKNSLSSAAGVTLHLAFTEKTAKRTFNTDLQEKPSEYSKCLRELQGSEVGAVVRPTADTTILTAKMELQVKVSKSSEESLNSWEPQISLASMDCRNIHKGDQCEHCLSKASKYSEHSPESREKRTAK